MNMQKQFKSFFFRGNTANPAHTRAKVVAMSPHLAKSCCYHNCYFIYLLGRGGGFVICFLFQVDKERLFPLG